MSRFRAPLALAIAAATLVGCGAGPTRPAPAGTRSGEAVAARSVETRAAAADLATRTLRANTHAVSVPTAKARRRVLYAGGGHFGALWTRDGMYGCLGLLAAGDHDAVRDCLLSLLEHQRSDGQLPRRLGAGSNAVGIMRAAIGLEPKADDRFDYADFAKPSVDANALVIWLAAEYVAASGDAAFAEAQRPKLALAADWLRGQVRGGLLTQPDYADWKDMNARGGQVLYSNALYYQALRALAKLDGDRRAMWTLQADELGGRIREAFWNEARGHFRDTTALADFSPEGDLMAVLFGIATPGQRDQVFRKTEALLALRPLLPALDGDYPASMIPVQLKVTGLQDYHDRFMWPWLTDLYAWTLAEAGQPAKAAAALDRTARLALRDGTFHEIYEGAEPVAVKRKLYHSEPAFSWHAGLYLRAQAAIAR